MPPCLIELYLYISSYTCLDLSVNKVSVLYMSFLLLQFHPIRGHRQKPKRSLNQRSTIIITMLFDDGVYLVISEIYATRQLRPRGLLNHFTIYCCLFIYFILFFYILTVKFQPHL